MRRADRRRRRALDAGPRAGPGVASSRRCTAWRSAGTSRRRAQTSRGSRRIWNCARPSGEVLPGYGWIFPLGNGEVNIGVGALATSKRPADAALRPLMSYYTVAAPRGMGLRRRAPRRAVGVAADGRRRVRSGRAELDADRRRRGLREPAQRRGHRLRAGDRPAGGRAAGHRRPVTSAWPAVLSAHYARGFSVARRLALLLTIPRFLPATGPLAMRSTFLMNDRGARDGQPRHRRGRRLGCAGVAARGCGVAADRRPPAVQLAVVLITALLSLLQRQRDADVLGRFVFPG